MKYLEAYDSFDEEGKEDKEIIYTIKDSLVDLIQNEMRVTYAVEREDNRIRVYITKYMHADFSLDDVKDPINHLISTMDDKGYPLSKSSYRESNKFSRINGWSVLSTTSSYYDIFDNINKTNIDSFELIFKLKSDSL